MCYMYLAAVHCEQEGRREREGEGEGEGGREGEKGKKGGRERREGGREVLSFRNWSPKREGKQYLLDLALIY